MTDLSVYINHPEKLDRDSLYELRGLLARYPYYQTARLLLLKNLYLLHDSTFGDELRKAALYVNDRTQLFMLVEGNNYIIPKYKKEETEVENGGLSVDRTLSLIDGFLDNLPELEVEKEKAEKKTSQPVDLATDYVSYLMQMDDIEPAEGEDNGNKMNGQDLIDGFLDKADERLTLDFASPRKKPKHVLSKFDDVEDDEETEEPEDLETEEDEELVPEEVMPIQLPKSRKKSNTISFSQNEDDDEELKNLNDDDDESYFTETLAKIYIKQQRYAKALEIIRRLSLKYPKKNRYFADQIRFLEKLIINSK